MAIMPDHDVRHDLAGFSSSHPRLTCYSSECDGATLVHQSYMTSYEWESKMTEFMNTHSIQLVTSADRGGHSMAWDGANFRVLTKD